MNRFSLAALVAVSLFLLGLSPAAAGVLWVTPATFQAQLAAAKGGDIISCAPGAYGAIVLQGKVFSPPLAITGPCVFSGVDLRQVQGLTLSGVEVAGPIGKTATMLYPVFLDGVRQVRLEGAKVHTDPANAWAGMRVQNSTDVTITRTEHWGSATAISWADMRGFEVSAGDFHDLQSDAISGAGGINVKILGNTCTRFKPVAGDHPDCVQFWNTKTTPNQGVLIQDNRYARGPGDTSTTAQGVFFEGQINDSPRSKDVVIAGNVALGSMYNGIAASGTDGLVIKDNLVAGFPDMQSWIRWNDVTSVSLTGNKAQNYISQYLPNGGNSGAPSGNSIIPVVKDGGAAILAALSPPAPPSTSPSPAADPRDTQLATLQTQVSDLSGQITALKAQGASLAANLAAVQGKADQAAQALSATLQDLDQDRAALAAIRAQAQAALDSNPTARP